MLKTPDPPGTQPQPVRIRVVSLRDSDSIPNAHDAIAVPAGVPVEFELAAGGKEEIMCWAREPGKPVLGISPGQVLQLPPKGVESFILLVESFARAGYRLLLEAPAIECGVRAY